jgi:predicted permease
MLNWLRRWGRRLRVLTSRGKGRGEMDEEMRFHLEMEVEELVARGMDPDEAYRQARVRFGGVERFKQEARDARGIRPIEDLLQDLRYALRGLRRAPGYAVAAVVTLALGIGANTAIFSVVDGVLLKPLPYAEPERLVQILEQNSPSNRWPLSVADFQAIEEQQRSFDNFTGLSRGRAILTGGEQAERVRVGWVTADWFNTLGVHPAEGRGFRPGEDRPDAEPVAVISHAFRERHFGLEADVVGKTLVLDGQSHTVVGVLPRGVETMAGWQADVWPTMRLRPPTRRGPFFIQAIARLRSGVSLQDAARDMAQVSERLFPVWADSFQDREARLTPFPLRDIMVGNVGGGLLLLFGAVGFVLLIALANVANLSLARATTREREVALRTSLGATRGRLTRQLLVESLTIAVLGGLAGLFLSVLALDALLALSPRLPRLDQVALDGRVLTFTALITIASGVLFGLAPLLHGVSSDLAAALRSGGRTASERKRSSGLRAGLVTGEFALALPLLAGAALLFTSLERLQRVDAGFDPDDLLLARASISFAKYPDDEAVRQFWERALPSLAAMPGVAAVGIGSGAPPADPGITNNFDLLDRPVAPGSSQPVVPWLIVSPGYLDALGVRLLQGRLPDETDMPDDPPVAAVSSSWAARFYPGEQVLGRQLYSGGDLENPLTIVGVVSDVKYTGLAADDQSVVYQAYTQEVQDRLGALDPDVPLTEVQMMHDRLADSVSRPRYWATLIGIFAVVGVALAAVGIYGVLSYSVGRQTREIGVRMALGADSAAVRRMVVRRGMGQAVLGLGAGIVGALFLTRLLEGLLFDISPTDPATLGSVSLLLLGIAFVACYWPARRATKVDPVRVLAED